MEPGFRATMRVCDKNDGPLLWASHGIKAIDTGAQNARRPSGPNHKSLSYFPQKTTVPVRPYFGLADVAESAARSTSRPIEPSALKRRSRRSVRCNHGAGVQ